MLILTRNLMRRYIVFATFGLVCLGTLPVHVADAVTYTWDSTPEEITLDQGEQASVSLPKLISSYVPPEGESADRIRYKIDGLPSGLHVSFYSGFLVGTPTELLGRTEFTYTGYVLGGPNNGQGRRLPIYITVQKTYTWSDASSPINNDLGHGKIGDLITIVLPKLIASNGERIRYTATGLPTGLTVSTFTGTLSGTPTSGGMHAITYRATVKGGPDNGKGFSRQFTFFVFAKNKSNVPPQSNGIVASDPVTPPAIVKTVPVTPTPVTPVTPTPITPAPVTPTPITPASVTRRRTVLCPVGWQHQTAFGTLTPQVLIRAVDVEIDVNNPTGIYTPVALDIYANPDDGRADLAGWKLVIAIPYNSGKEYLLTAENSEFDELGNLRIEDSAVPGGFLMTDVGLSGQLLPGFDYRLLDEQGQRVDLAISCYVRAGANLAARLGTMEHPRLERMLAFEHLGWDMYYRSDWELPPVVIDAAPGAPSLRRPKLTSTWASLKRRKE